MTHAQACPFCKSAAPPPGAPCGACGRRAAEAPTLAAVGVHGGGPVLDDGWDDDDGLGDRLEIARGESLASGDPSAYAGSGVAFDDDPFADDLPQRALELDLPSQHPANTPRALPVAKGPEPRAQQHAPAPPPMMPEPPPTNGPDAAGSAAIASQIEAPIEAPPAIKRDPAALVARYPSPPSQLWETPIYAMLVLWRQVELRQDLASLRRKRSADVALYERALRAYDARTLGVGLVVTCVGLALATVIVFLPVILRVLSAPD